MDDFERCVNFIHGLEEQRATSIVPFRYGRGFVNKDFLIVWDLNFLRVERKGATWSELSDAADEIQGGAGLSHRRIFLPDTDWAETLTHSAQGEGWAITPLIFMVRRDRGTRKSDLPVRELEYEEMRTMREVMARRRPWADTEDDVRQVLDANKAWAELVDARFFAAEVDGTLAAGCDLYRGPGLAQVEDVETLEEYQGRGLATGVVLAAAEAAHDDGSDPTVFLVADENDWPKKLYEQMGFSTVGRHFALLKTNLDD